MNPSATPAARDRVASAASWLYPLVLVVIVLAAYAKVPRMGFVYDDDMLVLNNPYTQSAENIPLFFGGTLWREAWHLSYYRPVFLLWMLGNNALFGLSPAGWHITGLLLYAGSCLSVYFLALRLACGRLPALFAGLFFGLHPVQVEVVSWVSASCELLGTFFTLAGFLCYLRATESGSRWTVYRVGALLLYAAGAFSKETAILLPALVFLHEWLGRPACGAAISLGARAKNIPAAVRESLPFLAVAAVYFAARVAVLGSLVEPASNLGTRTVLGTLPLLLFTYMEHLVWPVKLSLLYESRYVSQFSFGDFALPLAVVAIVVAAGFLAVRRSPAAQFAAAWMALALLPAVDIAIFPRGEFLHDRFLGHSLVGVALLAGLGFAWMDERMASIPQARRLLQAAGAVLIATLALVTFRQTGYWTDNFSLYSHCYQVAPRNPSAINNLGVELVNRGQLDQATTLFETGYRNNPSLWLAQYNLGRIYYQKGRYAEAVAALQKAIASEPNHAQSHVQLGLSYFRLGQTEAAIQCLKRGLALNPGGVGYHFALGIMLERANDLPGARTEFQAELRRDPQHQPSLDQLRQVEERLARATAQ